MNKEFNTAIVHINEVGYDKQLVSKLEYESI